MTKDNICLPKIVKHKTLQCNLCGYIAGETELDLVDDCRIHKFQNHPERYESVTWSKQSIILDDYRTGVLS